jgi:hypothetical protein
LPTADFLAVELIRGSLGMTADRSMRSVSSFD